MHFKMGRVLEKTLKRMKLYSSYSLVANFSDNSLFVCYYSTLIFIWMDSKEHRNQGRSKPVHDRTRNCYESIPRKWCTYTSDIAIPYF